MVCCSEAILEILSSEISLLGKMKIFILNIIFFALLLCGCSSGLYVDKKPVLNADSCIKPRYPLEALEKNLEGTVGLNILVTTSGNVGKINIARSSGSEVLDFAAQNIMSKCAFIPATKNSKPVDFWLMFNYTWSLAETKN